MRQYFHFLTIVLALSLALAACGGDGSTEDTEAAGPTSGDAARGEALYKKTSIGASSAPGCITCHSLEPGIQLVGPSHAGIGAIAGTRVEGQSAEAYLKESIT